MALSEKDTCKVLEAISNFINLFTAQNKDVLYCLPSGAPATKDIEQDLLSVDKVEKTHTNHLLRRDLLTYQGALMRP